MAWIKLYSEIWESWKIPALCDALDIGEAQAVGHLICLWCFTERNAWRDGDLGRWGFTGIARAAKWQGEAIAFVEALQGACFLDGMSVHAWKEHQAGMIHDRARRIPAGSPLNPRAIPAKSPRNPLPDKIREEKRREETSLLSGKPDEFARFWAAYPKKIGKMAARAAWQKAFPSLDRCLRALSWQIDTEQWRQEDGRFIPLPATWLKDGRWEDVPASHKVVICAVCGHDGALRKDHKGAVACSRCGSAERVQEAGV